MVRGLPIRMLMSLFAQMIYPKRSIIITALNGGRIARHHINAISCGGWHLLRGKRQDKKDVMRLRLLVAKGKKSKICKDAF